MIKFLTPLDTKVETTDLSTFFQYVKGSPDELGFKVNYDPVPTITDHPYELIIGYDEPDLPRADLQYGPYGASRVFCANSSIVNLPFSDSQRSFNPVIKYKVNGTTIEICLYTKVPVNGDSGYQLYNDASAQTIDLVTSDTVTNTKAAGNFCYWQDSTEGLYAKPLISTNTQGGTIPKLSINDVISERDLVSILNSLAISKEWIAAYVKEQLDIAIPQAVSQAVEESEAIISQRYVSR